MRNLRVLGLTAALCLLAGGVPSKVVMSDGVPSLIGNEACAKDGYDLCIEKPDWDCIWGSKIYPNKCDAQDPGCW